MGWKQGWPGCCECIPPPPCGWRFVIGGCGGRVLLGATVEIRQGGVLIDSCIMDGHVGTMARTNGGTGGTNGAYTDGTFTGGGGSGGTFSYSIIGGVVQTTLTVTNAGDGYTSAPTPVFGPAAGAGATATATLANYCRLTPPEGTYDVTISGPAGSGLANNVASRTFACSGSSTDQTVAVNLSPDSSHVCGCCTSAYAIPKTIHFTDSDGPQTLSWIGSAEFELVSSTSVAESCDNATGLPPVCEDCVSPGTATKHYRLVILTNCTARLIITTGAICCDNTLHFLTGADGFPVANIVIAITAGDCVPLNLEFNVPTTFDGPCLVAGPLPTPGGGGLLTFTA